MEPFNLLLSVLIGGIILFLWTGFSQNVFPWGVKSVAQHTQPDGVGERLAGVTNAGMVYVKDQVAAFIAIKPESYYSMGRYFGIELFTQFVAAAVLTAILALTAGLPDGQRFLIVALVAAAGIVSIDLPYWNWWGFSSRYTLGVAVNRLVGYLLAAFVLLTWVV